MAEEPRTQVAVQTGEPASVSPDRSGRYTRLPERVRPEDMIAEQAVSDPGDPTLGGRDPERDWMLRNAP